MRLAKNKKSSHLLMAALLAVSGLSSLILAQSAHAATMSQVLVRFDRMKISTFSSGTVCAKPASTATEAKVKVTFPTGFTVSSTTANWVTDTTTNTASWPTGGTAWPGMGTATAASGQDVTFPSTDLTVGTLYCFNWTNTAAALQEPSGTGTSESGVVTTQTSVPADIDTGSFSTATISDDQIVVNATVPVAFSFTLSANTDTLPTLNSGQVKSSSSAINATVNTNAKNGWLVWANDTNAGLHSTTASYTIHSNCSSSAGTNATLSAGTEGYNMGVTKTQAGGSGTVTLNSVFDNQTSPATGKGGGLCTNYQTLASSTGSASNAVVAMTNNVAIAGSTPAATDYTDTVTVVGAGLF
jgi:hypothetical protein